MKKAVVCIMLILLAVFAVGYVADKSAAPSVNEDYVRIHIRANGNGDADQAVKLKVRDAVVEFLTPVLSRAENVGQAEVLLSECSGEIVRVANVVLDAEGMGYGASVALADEAFPERDYGNLTLKAGVYHALVIKLGEGTGDNWWCIAFPPLCFVPDGSENVVYKSKILEIIEEWEKKNDE